MDRFYPFTVLRGALEYDHFEPLGWDMPPSHAEYRQPLSEHFHGAAWDPNTWDWGYCVRLTNGGVSIVCLHKPVVAPTAEEWTEGVTSAVRRSQWRYVEHQLSKNTHYRKLPQAIGVDLSTEGVNDVVGHHGNWRITRGEAAVVNALETALWSSGFQWQIILSELYQGWADWGGTAWKFEDGPPPVNHPVIERWTAIFEMLYRQGVIDMELLRDTLIDMFHGSERMMHDALVDWAAAYRRVRLIPEELVGQIGIDFADAVHHGNPPQGDDSLYPELW